MQWRSSGQHNEKYNFRKIENEFKKGIQLKMLLKIASKIFSYITSKRRHLYKNGTLQSFDFSIPVISVGNISLGGTGKTPTVLYLCDFFEQQNLIPWVLTRGYKSGQEKKGHFLKGGDFSDWSSDENIRNKFWGDEPTLIAKNLKNGGVVIGKNRFDNTLHFLKTMPQHRPDVLLLDDGFQHLKIQRDLNIVIIDTLIPLEKHQVFPKGILRESLISLKEADLIIFSKINYQSEEYLEKFEKLILKFCKKKVIHTRSAVKSTGVYDLNNKYIDSLKGKKIFLLSAIARPESFRRSVELLGTDYNTQIVGEKKYPDHYFFTYNNIIEVIKSAQKFNAIILTTEKDMIKIARVFEKNKNKKLNFEIYYLKMEIQFHKGKDLLHAALQNLF